MSPILSGLVGSLLAGLATGVGALPLLGFGSANERRQGLLLGFAAGVMLAAALFSLIVPAFDAVRAEGLAVPAALALVAAAVAVGSLAIIGLKWLSGPLMASARSSGDARRLPADRVWMFVAAITLHNLPEGLAVGVSFGAGDSNAGIRTALGIGIQNMPEGLAVAGLLASIGWSRGISVLIALASGLVEPVAGFLGAAAASTAHSLLPWALGATAGAMVQIIVADITPEIIRMSYRARAAQAATAGLMAMTALDTMLV